MYLGQISYGTYLWHWPVVLIATETLALDAKATVVLTCLVATGLASLSYRLLEQPVRQAPLLDRHRLVVIGTSLAISVIAALVVIPAIIDPDPAESAAPAVVTSDAGFTPVPGWVDTDTIYSEGFGLRISMFGESEQPPWCVDAAPDACTTVRGSGAHVLLMGDSNAIMFMPAFTELAKRHDLTLSLLLEAGCPWQRAIYRLNFGDQEKCRTMKEDAYARVIPALDPDVIVVINGTDGANGIEMTEAQIAAGRDRHEGGARRAHGRGSRRRDHRVGAVDHRREGSAPVPLDRVGARGVPLPRRHRAQAWYETSRPRAGRVESPGSTPPTSTASCALPPDLRPDHRRRRRQVGRAAPDDSVRRDARRPIAAYLRTNGLIDT